MSSKKLKGRMCSLLASGQTSVRGEKLAVTQGRQGMNTSLSSKNYKEGLVKFITIGFSTYPYRLSYSSPD